MNKNRKVNSEFISSAFPCRGADVILSQKRRGIRGGSFDVGVNDDPSRKLATGHC